MAEEYQRRWVGITNATDKAQAVRTLAEILTDKDGKAFISRLDSKDAELCVEILGNVSPELQLHCFIRNLSCSLGHCRGTRPQTRRETGFLRRVEETR